MTPERKKRFYPKRGDYTVDHDPISLVDVAKGRPAIDDSKLIEEAIKGINDGAYPNANKAASKISERIGGIFIDRNQKRLFRKIRIELRRIGTNIQIEEI